MGKIKIFKNKSEVEFLDNLMKYNLFFNCIERRYI